MSIQFTKAYVVGDKTYASLEDAKQASLEALFPADGQGEWVAASIAAQILNNDEKVLDILTTTGTSRPGARKVNGGRKPRKAKPAIEAPASPQE